MFRVSAGGRTGIMGNGHRRIKHNAQVQLTSPRDMHERPLPLTGLEYPDGPGGRHLNAQCTEGRPPPDRTQPVVPPQLPRATARGSRPARGGRRASHHALHRRSSLPIQVGPILGHSRGPGTRSSRPRPGHGSFCDHITLNTLSSLQPPAFNVEFHFEGLGR